MTQPLSPTGFIKDAEYTLASLKAYQGNPLIEALPCYLALSRQAIADKLFEMPDEKDITAKPILTRAEYLTTICSDLFVPGSQHQELFLTIDLMLRHGYRHRNPRLPNGLQYHEEALDRFKQMNANKSWQDPLSICIIGCPGTGKTSSVERVLQLYPDVYRHNKLWTGTQLLQIVHLRVECPEDGSVKSLCANIIRKIGETVGADYETQYCGNRATLNALKASLIRLLNIHCVGMLVIDEMQNLVNSRKNREELFNFLVSLSNSLKVPLIFIGTYKLEKFLKDDLRTARRFGSLGSFRWDPIVKNSPHWANLTAALWKTSPLQDLEDRMPAEVSDMLYDLSQGVTDIVVKLFILTQLRVLTLAAEHLMPEKVTAGVLKKVYEDHFSHVKPFADALRANDLNKLEAYGDIKKKDDEAFESAAKSMLDRVRESTSTENPDLMEARQMLHLTQVLRMMKPEDFAEFVKENEGDEDAAALAVKLEKALELLKKESTVPANGYSRIADTSSADPIQPETIKGF